MAMWNPVAATGIARVVDIAIYIKVMPKKELTQTILSRLAHLITIGCLP